MSDLATIPDAPLTAKQIRANVNLIQEVMQSVMKNGTHYGKIPGCGDKPALLKPGAEKIMATFRIAAEPVVEDLSSSDEVRFRVTCRGLSASGMFLGAGIGECSSNEVKYRWRRAVCDEEFNETPDDRRRAVWKRSGSGSYQEKQVRTNPADVANTVLKMAKKRAQVDMVLTCTAASDIFTQDIDDDDGARAAAENDQKPVGKPINPPQRRAPAQKPQNQDDAPPADAPEGQSAPPVTLGMIGDLEVGTKFASSGIVASAKEQTSSRGPYYRVTIKDDEAAVEFVHWHKRPGFVTPDAAVQFTGEVSEYQGKRQYTISGISAGAVA